MKVSHGTDNKKHVVLIAAYFKYSQPTFVYVEQLEHIFAKERKTIIGADTNGHSELWH